METAAYRKEQRRRASPSITVAALLPIAWRVCMEKLAKSVQERYGRVPERSRSALLMKLLSAATALQLAGYKPAKVVGERHLGVLCRLLIRQAVVLPAGVCEVGRPNRRDGRGAG